MDLSLEQIKNIRRWLGWGFVFSFVPSVLLLISLIFSANSHGINPPTPTAGWTFIDLATFLGIISLLTSCSTLIGFVFTTVVTWRKEKRDSAIANVELETKKLELEKLRLEIEKSRRAEN